MNIFVQNNSQRQVEITSDFYQFQNRASLTYESIIHVVDENLRVVHDSITVANYLKELPET